MPAPTLTEDPLTPTTRLLPQTTGPRPHPTGPAPSGPTVSYGYAQARQVPALPVVDLSGLTYCPERQVALDPAGRPAVDDPRMGSGTFYDTWYDHQKVTDTDQD